jgi:murein DD-endopeptidase MepM/ murein hydrolase activator NlpD
MSRKTRIRRVLPPALVLVCVIAAFGLLRWAPWRAPEQEAAVERPVSEPRPVLCLYRGTVDRGESLFDELVAGGISANETDRLVRSLSEVVNMKRLKPGECYEVYTNESGRLSSFKYVRSARERILGRDVDGEFTCWIEKAPLEERLRRIEGTIESSLWESLVARGADPELVLKLADLFAWEIDFLTDPRSGDTYDLVAQEFCLGDSAVEQGDILAARYRGRGKTWIAVGFMGSDGVRRYYGPDGHSLRRAFLKSPLNYRRISSHFTHRRFHPILKRYRPHLGVDYAASVGTPVVSIGDGVVARACWNGGFGNYVEIKHNSVYTTTYGHLSKYGPGIRKGVRVRQNQVIGYVGSTGLSTGPHLDFRVKKHGSYVNPLKLKSPRSEPVSQEDMARFRLESQWALWALDYVPAGCVEDAEVLRGALLAEASGEGRGSEIPPP